MTIVSALSPLSLTQFFYQSGKLVRPARLFFYGPGTEDRVTVYADAGLGSSYDQPVLSGGSGRVPPIYVGAEPYRVRVFDSYGALIEDIDYLPGATTVTSSGGTGSLLTDAEKQQLLQTGDYVMHFTKAANARAGFVRANGGYIGPGGFTGTGFPDIERKNDDCYALFKHLWGQDEFGALQVVPSKGADADSDWFSLAKLIRLPDLRGRAPVGLDGMGLPIAGRISPVPVTPTGQTNSPGSYGGMPTATLTAAQLAAHSHTINAAGTGVVIAAAATNVTIAGRGTGISIANATANLAVAYTGVYTAYAGTGISINYGPASISIALAPASISLVDPGHSHTYTSVLGGALVGGFSGPFSLVDSGTSSNTTGMSISDPWHTHSVTDPWHTHSVSDPTHVHTIGDPTHTHTDTGHTHAVSDPTHTHTVSDPTHAHTLTDPTHTHTLGSTGSSSPVPTMPPFLLTMIYIKL